MMMSKKRKSGLGKFILGAGLGIGLGMLFSPKTGKENRTAFKRKIDELVAKIKNIDSEEVKNTIQEKIDTILEEISDLDKEKVLKIAKAKSESIKEKAEDLVREITISKNMITTNFSFALLSM